jgi:alkylmercury lyase
MLRRLREAAMNTTSGSLPELADSLATTFPCCDDAPLALTLLEQLAKGEPVALDDLAERAGRGEKEIAEVVTRWPNVHLDDRGWVVAFGGLSLTATPHRFEVAGRQLYTWCAWDTLFLPALLAQEAQVESTCPVTGANIRLSVGPDGVRAAEPASLRVSFPRPDSTDTAHITASFCCHVHFLAGQDAAEEWLGANQGGSTLSLEEAIELGRLATRQLVADGGHHRGTGEAIG